MHPLEILQKKAIRIIYQANYRAHTNNFFIEGRILKLRDVVNYHTVQIIYKASKKSLPNSLQAMFEDREVSHDLRRKGKFTEKNIRTTLKSFSISVNGIKLWNGLDEVVTGSCSLRNFKANYVKKIIENYRLITWAQCQCHFHYNIVTNNTGQQTDLFWNTFAEVFRLPV